MIPLAIDPSRLRVGLAARGAPGLRRLRMLRAGGARQLAVFCDDHPQSEILQAAPDAIRHVPGAQDLQTLHLLWISGLPAEKAADLAALAHAQRLAVNVEDVPSLCDFHNVAEIRRGDLLLTVSTGGRNPGLAAALRKALDRQFGPEWAERLNLASDKRQEWREAGLDMTQVAALLRQLAAWQGWLQ